MPGISPRSHMDTKHSGNPGDQTGVPFWGCFYKGQTFGDGFAAPLPKLERRPALCEGPARPSRGLRARIPRRSRPQCGCLLCAGRRQFTGKREFREVSARHQRLTCSLDCLSPFALAVSQLPPPCLFWRNHRRGSNPRCFEYYGPRLLISPFSHCALGVCPEALTHINTHTHTPTLLLLTLPRVGDLRPHTYTGFLTHTHTQIGLAPLDPAQMLLEGRVITDPYRSRRGFLKPH